MKNVKKTIVVLLCAAVALPAAAAPAKSVPGSAFAANSPYATDAYPGFDGLDDLKRPVKKDKSWFNWVDRETPAEQYALAKELEAAGEWRKARRACDALVREWPSSPEAPLAQLMMAKVLASHEKDYDAAFEELEYLLDFYSRDCPYLELVEYEYKLVNLLVKERKSFLGFSFLSDRLVRQHYESIVRRAPGAAYVPEALLKIAELREQNNDYEEAVKVYAQLSNRFPNAPESRIALYLQAKARMWLCRRLAYNVPRCKDTERFLDMVIRRNPDLDQIEELRAWRDELEAHLAEDAFASAKFYDSRQRTAHAALAAWEEFLRAHPDSPHAEEARARIEELKARIEAIMKGESK